MSSRRDFIKNASLLSGAAGISTVMPVSIQRALAINPDPGTSWEDAEHIVFLMQENRSFDHCFGMLQGVRGFNDPRIISLPNNNPVWLQSNEEGKTHAPFRLNMLDSKSTWMDALPHSWENQVDAWNYGKYDRWLEVKKPGSKDFSHIPMTLGYYTRQDIPFYYALADAFTICDQNFCSSLTGTTPNRLFFWTGKIREEENSYARVRNSDTDYDTNSQAGWITFPERLQQNNVSWKIYQNEISVGSDMNSEEDAWLSNFTDNPIEWFTQYNVKLSETYLDYLETYPPKLKKEIEQLELADNKKLLDKKRKLLAHLEKEKTIYTRERYANLSDHQKELHNRAFTTNRGDKDYRTLETISYNDGNEVRTLKVPKGDTLYQFRKDVEANQLPTVSWLVAPQCFSDHPSSPWYGAWYLSEVFDILTKNPEVWKKTIFILTYDENDGFFDHVPPFAPPHPGKKETGFTSSGINTREDFVFAHQEATKHKKENIRESPIGLGFRVPLIIASPWSRGGWVNSEVFDHTSSLRFLEKFLQKKLKKNITETNISSWRRAVCGDLTSAFRQYNGEALDLPIIPEKKSFLTGIHQAKYKQLPTGYDDSILPQQEQGIRNSCALPYELYVDGNLLPEKNNFEIRFAAQSKVFGKKSLGAPFTVYSKTGIRYYAVEPGFAIKDELPITANSHPGYENKVYGPNGFYRLFKGDSNDPDLHINVGYEFKKSNKAELSGKLLISIQSTQKNKTFNIEIIDNSYRTEKKVFTINSTNSKQLLAIDTLQSFGWYDISLRVRGFEIFEKRYAGRIETGAPSKTDPLMAKEI